MKYCVELAVHIEAPDESAARAFLDLRLRAARLETASEITRLHRLDEREKEAAHG